MKELMCRWKLWAGAGWGSAGFSTSPSSAGVLTFPSEWPSLSLVVQEEEEEEECMGMTALIFLSGGPFSRSSRLLFSGRAVHTLFWGLDVFLVPRMGLFSSSILCVTWSSHPPPRPFRVFSLGLGWGSAGCLGLEEMVMGGTLQNLPVSWGGM
ncbi:hypothetical protein J4Q44_G00000150, partial [Coregonus suidteri]